MSKPAAGIHDLIGRRIGRFDIKARLGAGGMGEVFLAEDSVLKRQVAIKFIKPEHSQDTTFRTRLLKEAERASQLNDENIARIHDIVETTPGMFLVMEYVEGTTLRARLADGALAGKDFFSIARQCLAGLDSAHRCGILHCDLKPENLMIMPNGCVKILDFGFARRIPTEDTTQDLESSSTLALGGTFGYMAPEVLRGKPPDRQADIFSLGIVLYEALVGYHPFRSESAMGTAARILQEEPHPLPDTIPPELKNIIARMIAKDPAQRYQDCAGILTDIQAVQAGGDFAGVKTRSRPSRKLLLAGAAGVAILLVSALLLMSKVREMLHSPGEASASSRQLAVLPFEAAVEDPTGRAFARGLTATLTAKLGQIADRYPIEIIASSAVDAQQVRDIQHARSLLGATMVLQGSMQQSGNTIRVTYSLIDTRSLRQAHSGVITADASNPFAVQDRVIEEVLNDLDIELAKEDRGRMQSHGTTQPQAYAFYLRASGYLQEYDRPENLDNAIAAFQQGIAADSRFALAYAGLGQAYLRKYDIAHSPDSVTQAQDACTRAAELDSRSPEGETCLGMLFNTTGQYEQAAQHLERAVALDASHDESYRQLAKSYEHLHRLDDAEALLKKAIAVRPQYWAGYKWLGRFYAAQARYPEAIQQFKRVVELAPDSTGGYSNLAGVYIEQGDYAAAIGVLQQLIKIQPTAQALNNLGVTYFYQHNYQEAARSYERATQMNPNDYTYFGNLAEAEWQIPGRQDEARKNYAQALRMAERALAVNSRDGTVLSNAALFAAILGANGKAEQYREAAIRLAGNDPEVRARSGLVFAEFRKDDRALNELEQALQQGLSPTEVINNPAWQRFEMFPRYQTLVGRAPKKMK